MSVTLFPAQQRDELQAAIENCKRLLPYQIELAKVIAKSEKAKYDAYVAEGFTKEQALELLKVRGV